jgi:hypothetical protein
MVTAMPKLPPQRAMRWLLHTDDGRALVTALSKTDRKEQPIMNRTDQLKSIVKDFGLTRLCKRFIDDNDAHSISEIELHDMAMDEARKQFPNDRPDKAFTKHFNGNIELRKALAIAKDQQFAQSLRKSFPDVMSIEPTSTEVGSTDVEDDSRDAYEKLMEMAEAQRAKAPWLSTSQLFERVFSDPANAKLAARAHRRPNASSTSGSRR